MTVKIRQGVKWHNKPPINGRAMDIDDVLFSYNRLAEKGVPRGDVVNAANPNAPVLSFTATDRNTITIKLKEPTSYITAIFAYADRSHADPAERDGRRLRRPRRPDRHGSVGPREVHALDFVRLQAKP